MTLRNKIYLFAVKLFEDHGIKVDRAELLSLSILNSFIKQAFFSILGVLLRFGSPRSPPTKAPSNNFMVFYDKILFFACCLLDICHSDC